MKGKQDRKNFRRLLGAYLVAFLMSNGPGLYLVNKPVLVAGIPLLYIWAFLWALVQVGIVLLAYFMLWRGEIENVDEVSGIEHAGGEGP